MTHMFNRKGQGLTEFAIVLPIFIIMMTLIFFVAVYCYNIIALSTMSRDVARQLVVSCANKNAVTSKKTEIINHYNTSTATKPILYNWDGDIHVSYGDSDSYITVKMTASNAVGLGIRLLPDDITMSTTMYWENKSDA